MTEQQNWPADVVERGAEALWQAESLRAADRQRLIAWGDTDERTKEAWRFMYRAAISALSPAARAVIMGEAVAMPVDATPKMIEDAADELPTWAGDMPDDEAVIGIYDALLAASPWAQEPQR